LILSVASAGASAYGYSVFEDDVEFRIDYPVEMKVGTCSTVTFWIKASQNLTDLKAVFAIFYHSDSRVETLYSGVLISESFVEAGWTGSKMIQICIPTRAPPEPYLRAQLEITYRIGDGDSRELRYEWYMSVVRDRTYDELESEIMGLRNKVRDLESQVKALQAGLDEKIKALQDLQFKYQDLLENYSKLKARFEELGKQYDQLEEEYRGLRDSHQAALLDLERLRTRYELLARDYGSLEEKYSSLLKDYEAALSELKSYQSLYLDLKSRHEELQARHGELTAEAAGLRQRLSDLEKDYGSLSRLYEAVAGESSLTKNVLFAQTAAVAAGLGAYALLHRRYAGRGSGGVEASREGNGERRIQRILSGRRITIPSEVAAKLGLKEGDQVEIDYGDGKIIVRPVKEASNSMEKSGGGASGRVGAENN